MSFSNFIFFYAVWLNAWGSFFKKLIVDLRSGI